jgi:hypothetical protein
MSVTPEAPEPSAPQSGDATAPGAGYPSAPAAGYPAATPEPQQGTNGLAVAGLILAFLMAPIGFILSIIALIQTGKRRQKGKGLAIAGVIVSVLAMATWITVLVVVFATVGKNVATVADPGCTSGKEVIMNTASMASDPASVKTQLQTAVDGLNAAAAKAKHDNVRGAMKALADDYNQLLQAINTGSQPPAELEKKLEADANKIDELCTIGGVSN